ncbi:MAG: [protein-PII] uridylyltransferase [Desulfohalobiaceae bacterium]
MGFAEAIQALRQARNKFQDQCSSYVPGIQDARAYGQEIVTGFSRLEPKDTGMRDWALLGVGGLGRGELSFASDLDVLILYRKQLRQELQGFVQDLVCSLWDAGFEVGHAVLSPSGLNKLCSREFTARTSYLEPCFLFGDREFYSDWQNKNQESAGPRQKKKFLQQVQESRAQRSKRYAESIYLLEPHLKEGLGGLRDLHTLRWLGWIFLDSPRLEVMCSQGWITSREVNWLQQAQDFLWRVRLQLHTISRRKQDHLLLQDQEQLALRLGFEAGQDIGHGVEAFMRHYYWHTARVRRVTSFLLERLAYEIGPERRKNQKSKVLPGPFVLQGELIWFHDPELIRSNPALLMRFFAEAAKYGAHIQHETGQVIRESLSSLSQDWQGQPEVVQDFFYILQQPQAAFPVLKIMLETGFLEAFLPEFEGVRYRVQHDAYHTYTVDEHLLRTVQELHNLGHIQEEILQHRPDLEGMFQNLQHGRVLLLAGLIHDLGKGQGGRHARMGADLARDIGLRLNLGQGEQEILSTLVLKHLLLAETALKRDLSDEKPLERCALELGSRQMLDMLYLLTIADSRATGPQAWNSWRIALLNELYFKLRKMLQQEEWQSVDLKTRTKQAQEKILTRLGPGEESRRVLEWLEGFSLRYILNQDPEAIYRHFKMEEQLQNSLFQLDTRQRQAGMWELSLVCRDRPGLFDLITGALWANNLNILAADIYTRSQEVAIDVLLLEGVPDPLHPEQTWHRLERDLQSLLSQQIFIQEYLQKKKPSPRLGKRQLVRKKDRVYIDEQASDFYTVIEVYTWERPGVLHTISKTLHSFELNIQLAKISTPGAQVLDVFYVTDSEGNKLLDPEQHHSLTQALLKALGEC